MSSTTSTTKTGNVVVIDTGLSSSWSTGNLVYQHDFYSNDDSAMVSTANTHGALVTTDILQNAPGTGIIMLKVTPDDSSTTDMATIEKALQWVVANASTYNVTAVNLSLGGGAETSVPVTSISDELAALAAKRIITVAAAGNSGDGGATQTVSTFAADPNEICVSGSDGSGGFPTWSQRNPGLTDLCADGTDIRLTNLAGQVYSANGSSFSAPEVTAAVALAQQTALNLTGSMLTQDQFLSLAKSTGTAMTGGYTEINTDALLAKEAQTLTPATVSTAATTITVNASGAAAGGVNAHFTLLVDGQKVGAATVGSTAKDYSFTANLTSAQAHKVQVQYDNDGAVNGQDRNLFVDKVTINGHAVAPTDAGVTYDKGALDGKDVVAGQSGMWWGGTLVVDAPAADFPAGGTTTPVAASSTIVVNASGTPAGGVNAHFNLLVDGHKVGEGVAGTTAKDFTFKTSLSADAAHKVQVQYDNDAMVNGQDRSLVVNKVTINGHGVASNASNVTYDKGALDGKDVVAGQSGMWWNGTLVVAADKSYFPAATAAATATAQADDTAQQTVYQHLVTQGQGATAAHTDHGAVAYDHAAAGDLYGHAAMVDHHTDHHLDTLHHAYAA